MAEIGRSKGADPSEWYATFSPMSINNLDIEIFENGEWLSLKKGDGEFNTDLFNKNLEKTFVFKKGKEMEEQMMKEAQKQKKVVEEAVEEKVEEVVEQKVEEAVEEAVEDKVEEVVEEKVEEVVEEKVEEEKPKSKGIFSRIKNIFRGK